MQNWAKFGGFCPSFLLVGHFQEIGIAALPLGLKPSHVEKFRACRLTDIEESELGKRTDLKIYKNGCLGG